MTPHYTRLPLSADARYHARRKAALQLRIHPTPACDGCSAPSTLSRPAGFLQVNHLHGQGGARRATHGNAGEISRLLALATDALLAEVNLLCPTCHAADPHTRRFAKAGA